MKSELPQFFVLCTRFIDPLFHSFFYMQSVNQLALHHRLLNPISSSVQVEHLLHYARQGADLCLGQIRARGEPRGCHNGLRIKAK